MRIHLQRGFAVVELAAVVLLAVAIVGAGYVVYNRSHKSDSTPTALQQVDSGSTPSAPSVSDTSDLDTATKALDDTNLNASTSDTAELDAELSRF